MKKNLRLLCLGLAAATFTCSFAQEDKTSLLKNADMELASQGWGFEGGKVLGKNTKNPATQTGFYGMNKGVLEAWNADANTPLEDTYIMQRLSDMPSGTYVFGAYVGASKQNHRSSYRHVVAPGDTVTKWNYWSNIDSIVGVSLFANDAFVRVATLNPDLNGSMPEAHAAKFNVAVTLTDTAEKKGYLDAGLRVRNTNANYVVWDNATLYFFGDMSEEAALDAMAEIDMDSIVAIADTLVDPTKNLVMNADTLAALTAAIEKANETTTTAATLWTDSEELFALMAKARKSITDYANLEKNIVSVKEIAAGEWSSNFETLFLGSLNAAIAEAEAAYGEKKLHRDQLTALRKKLNWTAGDLKMDSVRLAKNALSDFIVEAKKVAGLPGGYSNVQIANLENLLTEVNSAYASWEQDVLDEDGEQKPLEGREINPNDLFAYVDRVNTAIETAKDNTISTEYTEMPILYPRSTEPIKTNSGSQTYAMGSFKNAEGLLEFTSPLYRFQNKITTFRITVTSTGLDRANNGHVFFTLSGLKFWDATGKQIVLDESMISTNADHITINPEDAGKNEGQGIPGLLDEDGLTFFHSAWKNGPSADHYLEITLPNGGYDAFAFTMVSRVDAAGGTQHTFPAEFTVATPMPNRDELVALLDAAKAQNAYSIPEPGFYEEDFSYLTDEIAKVEAALVGWPSEAECEEMATQLREQLEKFRTDLENNSAVLLPEADKPGKAEGKAYRLVSAVAGFYNQQSVEKAMSLRGDTALCWQDVCADSVKQNFVFEEIWVDGEHFATVDDYYAYKLKSADGRYIQIDSVYQSTPVKFSYVEETQDTVWLKSLSAGQWNIKTKGDGTPLHAGGHGSGSGKNGNIVGWSEGLGSASAWYIREYPELPLKVLVSGAEFKSEFIHFDAANTVTLTADKDCAFADLALYDLFGKSIAIDSLVVEGNVAVITDTLKNLVGCSFAFTNGEGVTEVMLDADWIDPMSAMDYLQEAYDAAVAIDPIVGTAVGEVADISVYTAALAEAEAMLENGASDEEIEAMIEHLDTIAKVLVPNMPEEGKYYFIYNAVEGFEKNKGYKMTMFVDENAELLKWGNENYVNWNRYWQFERATEEELEAGEMEAGTCAYFIKNVAAELYVADGATSSQVNLTDDREAAMPYVITLLGAGTQVALDGVGKSDNRLHANQHGNGSGSGSNIVYWGWNAGAGSASAWNIVEAQYDVTDIDFTEVETEGAVVKGTYDLFGRRVVAPTAPGIYIIEGKKRLVK